MKCLLVGVPSLKMANFEDGKVLSIFATITLLMFPRANVSVLTLLVALSIMSCGQAVVHKLEDIESYAEMSPDSALKSLSAIDSSDVQKGRARAMHTYVRSLARYKAYIDEYDDTDISDAAEYFHGHNDKAREMRALFFKGYALYNAGKLNQAIIAFTDSEKIAEELEFPESQRNITIYSARHSFAMTLKNKDKSIEIISQALGHQSVETTKHYLAKFSTTKMAEETDIDLLT